MRLILLAALLGLAFTLTGTSLLIIRFILQRQIAESLRSDLNSSVRTYANLAKGKREMLSRSSALLADLPSLKALMTTGDRRTIQDGGVRFWQISGSDLFLLKPASGPIVASYSNGAALPAEALERATNTCFDRLGQACDVSIGGKLFEMVARPLLFGPEEHASVLGYVGIAYAIDAPLAREVSEAADANATFLTGANVAASTLPPTVAAQLSAAAGKAKLGGSGRREATSYELNLGGARYLATSVPLALAGDVGPGALVVMKSYDHASESLRRVNLWISAAGAMALLLATVVALQLSRAMTEPLVLLVQGARALGRGDFTYGLGRGGTAEIGELRTSFGHMRAEVQKYQRERLDAERLATIGRMAHSISHDLRHYLSAMYANAEFLSLERTTQPEREELIAEVGAAVHGMTDLLDSLLLFGRTGRTVAMQPEPLDAIVGAALRTVRAHPSSRGVRIEAAAGPPVEVVADSSKLGRALFNLLLNACEAAKAAPRPAVVHLRTHCVQSAVQVLIEDSGTGVPQAIRETLFQPFVSAGKASGVGLGLTLALHIAQEHGGTVSVETSDLGWTRFLLSLPISGAAAQPALLSAEGVTHGVSLS